MPNTIELFKKYTTRLDAVYKSAARTAILDSPEAIVNLTSNNEFKVPKMTMDGLADYSRKDGYKIGSVTLEFETKKPDYDRARKFRIEEMDNEETAGVAFGSLASEFIRTKVVPEMDAFRFAKMCAKAGTIKNDAAATGADILALLVSASSQMSEKEVGEEGRILFITPTFFNLANGVDTTKNKAVLDSFAQIIQVPQGRFYSKITLADGSSSGQESGGFSKASDGKKINFMIVSKDAIIQGTKHNVNKIIDPKTNQDGDFWDFFYRAYGISDVYEKKVDGIFAHVEA
ncbi:hypothetical protein [Treponema pectinovorum]|uniref:hypothetical protein n=1 Tax=Treponema pectinovorum TaxID=164 RepID=UPI0011CC88A2|nr:hypothetical protein [Treponema pectinovorum]